MLKDPTQELEAGPAQWDTAKLDQQVTLPEGIWEVSGGQIE